MKKYYKVAHAGVVSIPKSKELNSDSLDELLDNFINWKYEESWFTDLNIDKLYFHNEVLNIDKLYFKDEDVDNDILINKLFEQLYTFYTNKLEDDKCLDIGDYDIIIKEDINNDK
jgi:hypothetical protein